MKISIQYREGDYGSEARRLRIKEEGAARGKGGNAPHGTHLRSGKTH